MPDDTCILNPGGFPIVLEGPDAAGKTTLGNVIVQNYGSGYFKAAWSRDLDGAMFSYQGSILDNAEHWLALRQSLHFIGRHYVLDRHWPSQWVYGTALRGLDKQPVVKEQMLYLRDRLKRMRALYIFCSGDIGFQIINHRQNLDPAHPYKDSDYVAVCEGYFAWYKQMVEERFSIVRYDLRKYGSRSEILEFVDGAISDHASRQ